MTGHNNTWWQVKGRGITNLGAIKDVCANHEYTLREFDITITDEDVEAVNCLLGDIRHFGSDFQRRLGKTVHCYVTALVKLIKQEQGLKMEWEVGDCSNFSNYVELARGKLEAEGRISWEVEDEARREQSDDEEPDFRGVNTELLQFETDSPGGLEAEWLALCEAGQDNTGLLGRRASQVANRDKV